MRDSITFSMKPQRQKRVLKKQEAAVKYGMRRMSADRGIRPRGSGPRVMPGPLRWERKMKRDMDLVRKILFAVEKHPSGFAPNKLEIPGHTEEEIAYHAYIMKEAGLVGAIETTPWGSSSPQAQIARLTWQGHEFLDAARQDRIWQKAKLIVKKVGGATIQIWMAVLRDLVKQKLGLSNTQ